MISAVSSVTSKVSNGKCPHGMPLGACPICNGMQGGGGKSASRAKEMTWDECYAMGLVMKAQSQRADDAKQFQMDALLKSMAQSKFVQTVAKYVNQVSAFVQANIVQPVSDFVNKVATTVMRPIKAVASMVANSALVKGVKTAANFVKQGLINVSDKLAAVFGEPMTAVANFLSENWRKLKPKKFIFFAAVDTEMEQGESDEEVELKRILILKTFKDNFNKLFKVKKRVES